MADGFLFSYSDIVFAPDHAQPGRRRRRTRWRWSSTGAGATPTRGARCTRSARPSWRASRGPATPRSSRRVGKRLVAADEAAGEFIGLARFSPEGAAALRDGLARGARPAVSTSRSAPPRRCARPTSATASTRWPRAASRCARCSSTAAGARSTPRRTWRARSRWSRRCSRRRRSDAACPVRIPTHWLHRLTAAEWLAAAETELDPRRGGARADAPRAPASRTRAAPRAWPGTRCCPRTRPPTASGSAAATWSTSSPLAARRGAARRGPRRGPPAARHRPAAARARRPRRRRSRPARGGPRHRRLRSRSGRRKGVADDLAPARRREPPHVSGAPGQRRNTFYLAGSLE